jgi:putative endonuclease
MPFTYILYSHHLNKYYIGSTLNTVEERLNNHISKKYGNSAFTAKTEDWMVFWFMEVQSIGHAKRLELKLKSMKSIIYLQNLLKYPELCEKLYKETE